MPVKSLERSTGACLLPHGGARVLRGRLDHGAGKPYIPAMVVRVINSLAPARRARGWSQAQTAAACGVSRQSYSGWEQPSGFR